MRRSILGALVLAVGTIALTQPAVAKCVSGAPRCPKIKSVRAVIRGPGLHQPVVIRGEAFWNLARRTGISGYRTAGVEYAIEDEFPGEQALGPRYVVRYVLRVKGREPIMVVQDLYPYAVNTGVGSLQVAWAFTPRSQRFVTYDGHGFTGEREPVEGGWWKSAALFQTLVSEGLPMTPPVASVSADTEPRAEAVAGHESVGGRLDQSAIWGGLLLLALVAMLASAAITRWIRSHSSSG